MKGLEVKKTLKKNGVTLISVARKLGISPQHLHNILGSDDIKSGWLQKIQDVTGIRFLRESESESDSNINLAKDQLTVYNCLGCQEKQKEIEILRRELEKNTDYINLLKEQLMSCQEDLRNCRESPGKSKAASA